MGGWRGGWGHEDARTTSGRTAVNKAFDPAAAVGSGTPAAPVRPRRQRSALRRAWRGVEHWIVVAHRWIGIGTCVLAAIWCLSGIAIMYVVSPKLTEVEHHTGLTPI